MGPWVSKSLDHMTLVRFKYITNDINYFVVESSIDYDIYLHPWKTINVYSDPGLLTQEHLKVFRKDNIDTTNNSSENGKQNMKKYATTGK